MIQELEPIEPSGEDQGKVIQDLNFNYPFLRYASKLLLYHIEESQREGIAQYAPLQLLEQSSKVLNRLTSFHDILESVSFYRYGKGAKPLYIVASHGYYKLVQLLLEGGAEVNAQGGHYGNALQAAAAKIGGEAAVQLLLEHGAHNGDQ
jgi:hypothetical protein